MKEVALQGGGLTKCFVEKNIEIKGHYKKMVVRYPIPPEGNDCLIKTTFCLTLKNRCFKYVEEYWGKELADQKIDEFKRYYHGLKQVKNEQKWIDNDNRFEIDLIPERIGNNKFASAYHLEVKKI
ncbi:MAG TPA: hypothetical protein VNX40_04830 [Mucilaginibacter sp.]|nr:hypothetical protein [Mucilaginibacter sp.]